MKESKISAGESASRIPGDFDPDRYAFRDDFSLWMSSVACRIALKEEFEEFSKWRIPEEEATEQRLQLRDACRVGFQNRVQALINTPILKEDSETFSYVIGGSKFFEREKFLQRKVPIKNRLILDENQPVDELRERAYRDAIDQVIKRHPANGFAHLFVEAWQVDMQMPHFSGEFGIKVNLHFDDEALCEAFSAWLKETRESAGFSAAKHKIVTLRKLQEWHRMRVLPCMDLWLYQRAFGVEFSFEEIGQWLYEGEDGYIGGEEYERRAEVACLRAEKLMIPSVFLSLRYKSPRISSV